MARNQWGFYFDQSRCLGCKACVLACKNWNEERRGDISCNVLNYNKYESPVGGDDRDTTYIDPKTGKTNYIEFRKFYMKEDWRRVETHETGAVRLNQNDNTFDSQLDRRYISLGCNHCENPACLVACPVGAIQKDEEKGLVLNDRRICISCGRCKAACPWDAPQFYDDIGAYAADNPNRPRMTKCTLCKDRIDIGLKPACVAACWNRALQAGPIARLKEENPTAKEELRDFSAGSSTSKPNIIFKSK